MAFILILLASLLLFSKSKYFPERWQALAKITRQKKILTRIGSYVFLAIAAILYIRVWGAFTGFVIWATAVMLCLSSVVMLLPLLAKLLSNKQINSSTNQQ